MQNHARKPISARPTIGPTTTPAIQALLEDFSTVVPGAAGEVVVAGAEVVVAEAEGDATEAAGS